MMHDVEMVKNDPTKRLLQQAMQMDKVIKFDIGCGLFVQYGRSDCCLLIYMPFRCCLLSQYIKSKAKR